MRKFKQRPGGRATCACMCPASEWCPARTLPRQGRRRGCAVGVDRMRRCPMSWWSPRGPRPSRPAITRGGPLGVEALGRHGALSWSRTGPVQASWATTTRMPGRSHLRRNGPDPQHHQLQAVAPSGEATMEHARVLEPSLTGGGHLPGDEMDRPDLSEPSEVVAEAWSDHNGSSTRRESSPDLPDRRRWCARIDACY